MLAQRPRCGRWRHQPVTGKTAKFRHCARSAALPSHQEFWIPQRRKHNAESRSTIEDELALDAIGDYQAQALVFQRFDCNDINCYILQRPLR